jgi:uncharacterized protein (TIGR02453 family)
MRASTFSGFSREGVEFLTQLKENNNREWFEAKKHSYENAILHPAMMFVAAMGEKLRENIPDINADPRRDRSIFRIHRDTRFSRDKSPYKTHLGIFFWEGLGKKMECPGFYFHLEPPDLGLYAGMHDFPAPLLKQFREAVVDQNRGKQLEAAIKKVKNRGPYEVGGLYYKRVPKGYDPEHPSASLLLYKGLWAGWSSNIPDELYRSDLVDFCASHWLDMLLLHRWLMQLTQATGTEEH